MDNKTKIFLIIGVGLCGAVFVNALFSSTLRSPEKGVWRIKPFFAYNLTRGAGGKNYVVEGQQVLRIMPVGDGHRYHLYGAVNYSLASDLPYPVDDTPTYVIEGHQVFKYSSRDLIIWIKVDKMYECGGCPK